MISIFLLLKNSSALIHVAVNLQMDVYWCMQNSPMLHWLAFFNLLLVHLAIVLLISERRCCTCLHQVRLPLFLFYKVRGSCLWCVQSHTVSAVFIRHYNNNMNNKILAVFCLDDLNAALIQWILDCSSDISLTYLFVGEYSVLWMNVLVQK